MSQGKAKRPQHVAERNIELTRVVMTELIANPALLEQLPPGFRLVVLPEGEPDLWLYNMEQLNAGENPEAPVVFARIMPFAGEGRFHQARFYAPLAA